MKGYGKTIGALLWALCLLAAAFPAAGASEPGQAALSGDVPSAQAEQEALAERLFLGRRWQELDALARDAGESLSPRALSLAANACWMRGQWQNALDLMARAGSAWPEDVRPYGKLLMSLGLERCEKKKEAYDAALELYKAEPPQLVRYYVMLQLSRLTSSPDEKEKWLRRMASMAFTADQEASMLRELFALGRMKPEDALRLLTLTPTDRSVCALAEKAPESAEKSYRLGYSAYLANQYAEAEKHLKKLSLAGPLGEAGTYYLGMSLYRQARLADAEKAFTALLFKKDSDYISRSLARLSIMLGGPAGEAALASMKKALESPNAAMRASALYSLATSSWERAGWARETFLKEFPDEPRALALHWSQGWDAWLAGDAERALTSWRLSAGEKKDLQAARALYWQAKALRALNRQEEAQKAEEQLLREHCLTIYAFLLKPEGSLKVADAPLPEELTSAPPSSLERWGFMTHARMVLPGKGPAERMARARLADWLGLEGQSYRDVHGLIERYMTGPEIPRKLLEMAYPRPFRKIVEKQAERFGLDPLYVWSVMKQESGFDPGVTSWVGAVGLMQLMPFNVTEESRKIGLKNPRPYSPADNIAMGCSHLAGTAAAFGGDLDRGTAAYNGGGSNVRRWNERAGAGASRDLWMETVGFRETNGYVKKVMANYEIYKMLYGGEASAPGTAAGESPERAPEAGGDAPVTVEQSAPEETEGRPKP